MLQYKITCVCHGDHVMTCAFVAITWPPNQSAIQSYTLIAGVCVMLPNMYTSQTQQNI